MDGDADCSRSGPQRPETAWNTTMSNYLKGTLLEVSLWLALCVLAYAFSFEFDEPFAGYRYGPAAWPRGISLMTARTPVNWALGTP